MLHSDLLKPYVEDWEAVACDVVPRTRRGAEPGDEIAARLFDEVLAYPGVPEDWREPILGPASAPFLNITFNAGGRRLSWITTVTTFGTPQDITLQELRIESFIQRTKRQKKQPIKWRKTFEKMKRR